MKVAFFLLDGETNASSRHRALQYFPLLRQHGIDAIACRPVPEPVYQRFVERRPGAAASKAAYYSLFLAQRTLDVLRAGRFDAAVIQRDLFPFGPPWLERLLAACAPRLVYDTDDATYLRPGFTPNTPFQRLRRFDKVVDVVTRARWVSAATQPIADWARGFNPNVSVVPMAVDLAEYEQARASAMHRRAEAGPVVIGWAGTAGGLRYLDALAPVLRDLAARYDVVVRVISGGYRDVCLPGVTLDARPWRPAHGLADMARFDIGVVPLDDTPFERAKFPFKLLQYLALGVPSVSARVGTAVSLVRGGDNGLLASTSDEWRQQLESLIVDRALRQRLATAGRDTVAASYSLEHVGPLLANGLLQAAA
jgi:glycosyltransferase involved in cell wall biosynthesis